MDAVGFVQAMSRWHDFYILTGTAAATLMGLIFVALSFGIGIESQEKRTDGINTFVTPTMVHFVDVLVIGATAVAPVSRVVLVVVLLAIVLVNVAPGLQRFERIREFHRLEPFDWRDWWWYLVLPVFCQVMLVFAAIRLYMGNADA